MIVKDTIRNIKQLYEIKNNIQYAMSVSELEPEIDGAVLQNLYFYKQEDIDQAFKDFVNSKFPLSVTEYTNLFHSVKRIDGKAFCKNPYLKNIKLDSVKVGNITLEKCNYKPYEFAIMDEPKQDSSMMRSYSVGIFDHAAFTYVLRDDVSVWMSINPMEINTATSAVANASGSVLVLGGGLAYYPYMVSLKDEVTSIEIVESNESIYQLLKDYILPQFPNRKVTLTKADAYEFIRNTKNNYDTIYIDTWRDNLEGYEFYKKFVQFEEKFPNAKFDYWLEKSMLDNVTMNIYQYFSAKVSSEEYQRYFSVIAPDLWNYLEKIDTVIERPDQLDYYLSRNFAKTMIKEIYKKGA